MTPEQTELIDSIRATARQMRACQDKMTEVLGYSCLHASLDEWEGLADELTEEWSSGQ
jgi:hypothetical protein